MMFREIFRFLRHWPIDEQKGCNLSILLTRCFVTSIVCDADDIDIFVFVLSPLTHEEIEKRREIVRQKQLERQNASKIGEATNEHEAEGNQTKDAAAPAKETEVEEIKNDKEEQEKEEEEPEEEEEVFIAFARIFSGTLKKGRKLYVLGPKYDPLKGLNLNRDNQEEQNVVLDSISRLAFENSFS